MGETDKVNKALEQLGSTYRASPGSSIGESMAALIEALPSYIDREIDRRVKLAPFTSFGSKRS